MPYYATNLLTRSLASDDVLYLRPGANRHVEIVPTSATASLWLSTRYTGGLSSDNARYNLLRAGEFRWSVGFNLDSSGDDNFHILRWGDGGALSDAYPMTINRSTMRVDFAGAVYSNGVLLTGDTDDPLEAGTVGGRLRIIGTGADPSEALAHALTIKDDDGRVMAFSNTSGTNTQQGGGLKAGLFGLSWDGGMGWEQNYWYPSGVGKLHNPGRPRTLVRTDSLGALSYEWEPAVNDDYGEQYGFTGVSNNPWDFFSVYPSEVNQSLIIKQEYQVSGAGGGSYGGHLKIATMRPGHTLGFYTSNAANDPKLAMLITAHANPGNVNIYRQLVILSETADVPGLKFSTQTGTPTSAAGAGSMWFDGTNWKGVRSGAVVTFTVT